MAAAESAFNKAMTPIAFLEESFTDTKKDYEQKVKRMRDSTKVRSPLFVGSIEEVNRRISNLDRQLNNFKHMTLASRSTDFVEEEEDDFIARHHRAEKEQSKYQAKLDADKEVNQFAGVYSIKTTLFPSRLGKKPRKKERSQQLKDKAIEEDKPKFIELHKYSGFDADSPSSLPNNLPTTDVLSLVVQAHPRLSRAPKYRPVFESLFFSEYSKNVLLDIFWWYFLQHYQHKPSVQSQLFSRTSSNYMELRLLAENTAYKETFLKEYPDLLAQSLYCALCRSFPDSYHRFTDSFRDSVMFLAYEWVIGTHPAPCTWTKWNLKVLEPPSMRIKQEILDKQEEEKDKKSKGSARTGSIIDFSTVEQAGSLISNSTMTMSQRGSLQLTVPGQRQRNTFAAPRPSRIRGESVSSRGVNEKNKEVMSTITERDEDDLITGRGPLGERTHQPHQPSHIAGPGAKFQAVAFNVNGRSPLVQQYLRSHRAEQTAGTEMYMQRREILAAVPLAGETYHDIVVNQFSQRRKQKKQFQKQWMVERDQWKRFENRMMKERKEYDQRETSLLNQRVEVKRLCDLLMLEVQKDPDSISAMATEELELALQSQQPKR